MAQPSAIRSDPFFLYTLLGSLLMLVALLYLYNVTGGSFTVRTSTKYRWTKTPQNPAVHRLLHGLRRQGVPMWPVPHLVARCPRVGSAHRRFGGLRPSHSKLGAYGFLRFILLIVPDALACWHHLSSPSADRYRHHIGFVAWVQTDARKSWSPVRRSRTWAS